MWHLMNPKCQTLWPVSVGATWKLFNKGQCFSAGMCWHNVSLMNDKPAPMSRKTLTSWSLMSPFICGVQAVVSTEGTVMLLWATDSLAEDRSSPQTTIHFPSTDVWWSVNAMNGLTLDKESYFCSTAHLSARLGPHLGWHYPSNGVCRWVEKTQSHRMKRITTEGWSDDMLIAGRCNIMVVSGSF